MHNNINYSLQHREARSCRKTETAVMLVEKIIPTYQIFRSNFGRDPSTMPFDSALELELHQLATSAQPPGISIRRATIEDLDAMVEIALAAMPQDPQWNWRFPYRLQFPDDTRGFTRVKYKEFLQDSDGQWRVMLAEGRELDGQARPKAIAMAIWNVKNLTAPKYKMRCQEMSKSKYTKFRTWTCAYRGILVPFTCLTSIHGNRSRRDANTARMKAFTEILATSKKIIFDELYGQKYFTLQVLATSPAWQRRGAGTMLCQWGITISLWTGMAISVFASPMGQALYRRLGFRPISTVNLVVEGDSESVSVLAMSYEDQSNELWQRGVQLGSWTISRVRSPVVYKVWSHSQSP
jgi:ribosomal protein S18 acetylase RimI-like enzyme